MKPRILIVEDDEIIQLDLRLSLQDLGYMVVGSASSGVDAVSKTTELQPDLVLMDIRLRGDMDGIEAARQIQSTHNVPVIFLTAQSGNSPKREGAEVPEPRITKPFTQGTLQTAITRALRQNGRSPL